MKLLSIVFLLISLPLFAAPSSKVILPLEEYTKLKDHSEAPDLTVIESVAVSGEYGKNLRLAVKGASSGKSQLVNFMELPKGSLYDCKGSAIIQKSAYAMMILAQASRFSLECSLHFPNWNEANFSLINVLHQDIRISNGDVVLTGDTARQSIALTRTATLTENEKAEVTVVGHHRLTVLPEETRFEYRLQLSNPGRSKKTFMLPLRNGEMVQTVTADGEYKDSDSGVEFSLNPGINTVSVVGRFKTVSFQVPLPSAQNFLLIENSPMLQLTVETKARRVSVQDTGMYSQYSTSRAYLLSSNEAVTWAVKKLEVFASTGFSVNNATYTVYLPRTGQGIVEAQFEINNQGTPEIPLKIPNKVTYVEVGGVPQVLLKDPAGALLIQVPTGVQQVLVQYEGSGHGSFMGQVLADELVRPSTVMSDVSLNVRLSPKWNILFGRGIFESKTDLNLSCLLWGLVLALLIAYLLKRLALPQRDVIMGAVGIFLLSTLLEGSGAIVVFVLALVSLYKNRHRLKEFWPQRSWAQIGIVTIGIILGVVIYSKMNLLTQGLYDQKIASVDMASESYAHRAAPGAGVMMKGRASPVLYEESAAAPVADMVGSSVGADYKGLPARIKIPDEGRVLSFHQGMIDADTKPELRLFLVDRGVGAFLLMIGLVLMGVVFYRHRLKLMEAIKA